MSGEVRVRRSVLVGFNCQWAVIRRGRMLGCIYSFANDACPPYRRGLWLDSWTGRYRRVRTVAAGVRWIVAHARCPHR